MLVDMVPVVLHWAGAFSRHLEIEVREVCTGGIAESARRQDVRYVIRTLAALDGTRQPSQSSSARLEHSPTGDTYGSCSMTGGMEESATPMLDCFAAGWANR